MIILFWDWMKFTYISKVIKLTICFFRELYPGDCYSGDSYSKSLDVNVNVKYTSILLDLPSFSTFGMNVEIMISISLVLDSFLHVFICIIYLMRNLNIIIWWFFLSLIYQDIRLILMLPMRILRFWISQISLSASWSIM